MELRSGTGGALAAMLNTPPAAAPAAPTPPPVSAPPRPSAANAALTAMGADPGLVGLLDEKRAAHSALANSALEDLGAINSRRNEIASAPLSRPEVPTLPETPAPPDQTLPANGLRVYGQFLPVLAMLGGTLVNRDATATLRIGASAMRAARANDVQNLELQNRHWEQSMERLLSDRQAMLDQYKMALEDSSLTRNDRLAMLDALSAQENNWELRTRVSMGDLEGIANNINTQLRAVESLRNQQRADRELNIKEQRGARGRGGGGGGVDRMMQAATDTQNVLSSIERARTLATQDTGTTGLQGQVFRGIGGNAAYDLDQLVDGITSNIGFDRLQRMRDNSPTGGALGSVTERELQLLQRTIASLDTAQSTGQFLANLQVVEQQYLASMASIQAAYDADVASGLIGPEGLGGASGDIPQEAIEYLRANPDTAELFEQQFGLEPGDAQQFLAGP